MGDQKLQPSSSGVIPGMWLRLRWLVAGLVVGCIGPQALGLGRSGRGPAEEIGQVVDRAARAGAASIGLDRDSADEGRSTADEVGERLAKEEGLESSRIEVRPGGDGVIELRGVVAGPLARERAISAAKDTRGVSEVVDSLAVASGKGDSRSTGSPEVADSAFSTVSKPRPPRAVLSSRPLVTPR